MKIEHHSHSPQSTERLAQEISLWARPGQCILLSGDLGSGKSTFARAFIQALGDSGEAFDIPSPTFSIIQTYDHTRVPVAHVDLYRLQSDGELDELGLEDVAYRSVLIVEWPERLFGHTFDDCLAIHFSGRNEQRTLQIIARGNWITLMERNAAIRTFLETSRFAGGIRSFLEGDASSRRYESVSCNEAHALLMDMPKRPDGPIVKDNKPYSAIAHLAEGIGAVVGINDHLREAGYSAPEVYHVDVDAGLALIEPLGTQVFGGLILQNADMRAPMGAAVEVIAEMAGRPWPARVPVRDTGWHAVQDYDEAALLIEVNLLLSWYWPHTKQETVPHEVEQAFHSIWQRLISRLNTDVKVWTLRDFHSPNLLWLPERTGVRRVGLIDTQDCVMGHPAYDLVSLLQDARVDIDAAIVRQLFEHYCGLRAVTAAFDRQDFTRDFAILGAQRATKILGIFARLHKRDGKPAYLRHMPRVSRYLRTNLEHPALAELRGWHDTFLPLS